MPLTDLSCHIPLKEQLPNEAHILTPVLLFASVPVARLLSCSQMLLQEGEGRWLQSWHTLSWCPLLAQMGGWFQSYPLLMKWIAPVWVQGGQRQQRIRKGEVGGATTCKIQTGVIFLSSFY